MEDIYCYIIHLNSLWFPFRLYIDAVGFGFAYNLAIIIIIVMWVEISLCPVTTELCNCVKPVPLSTS